MSVMQSDFSCLRVAPTTTRSLVQRADEIGKVEPRIAYYCRLYAIQQVSSVPTSYRRECSYTPCFYEATTSLALSTAYRDWISRKDHQ